MYLIISSFLRKEKLNSKTCIYIRIVSNFGWCKEILISQRINQDLLDFPTASLILTNPSSLEQNVFIISQLYT